tara:strand:- start:6294 stop:6959 length:666 start_codon:yes stop_codon:yes gene_type:complete
MKITIYNSKGGAGKTPIATNIALDREYAIGTNEAFDPYEGFIPDERLMAIDLSERFPDVPEDIDIVFDLAGAISTSSHSITSAIKQSHLVIVPISSEFKSLKSGIGTLREIEKIQGFKGSILVVATKLTKGKKELFNTHEWHLSDDFKLIKNTVESQGFNVPVLPLKFSKVFDTIFEKEMSIEQLRKADALANYTYRDISAQFDAIYKAIDLKDSELSNAK